MEEELLTQDATRPVKYARRRVGQFEGMLILGFDPCGDCVIRSLRQHK
jgi:hypothetical protein